MTGQTKTLPPRLAKPWQKFLIGFVGGLSAAIFPRLMAALALYGGSEVVIISTGYLGLAVIFAAMVGAVVMIMEWGVLREPRATFMTALGIPALLAGAMNTTNGAYVLDMQEKDSSNQLVQEWHPFSEEMTAPSIIPLSDAGAASGNIAPLFSLGIGMAYAADGETEQTGLDFNPSLQIQRQYYIVLEQAEDADVAKQRADALKTKVPSAQAVKAGNRFLVIDSQPRSRYEATFKAIQLKNKYELKPQLLRVR